MHQRRTKTALAPPMLVPGASFHEPLAYAYFECMSDYSGEQWWTSINWLRRYFVT